MSNQIYYSAQIRHLQLWIYLLPVVGIVPAVWTLYRAEKPLKTNSVIRSNSMVILRQQQKTSRLALNLALLWLSCYSLLSLGAANVSGVESFRLLYTNAMITTGYFLTCTFLMFRSQGKTTVADDTSETTKIK